MGSGILGLAFAMSNTGIVLFIILLVSIAILSAYSIHLLLRSAGIVGIRAYEQLGNHAFGNPGKVIAACIITVHNIGAMSSYLFIVKSELPLVIQAFLGKHDNTGWFMNGNYLIIIVSAVIIFPLALMKQLGYLGYTSGFSLSCMVFFLIAVIYKKFNIPCPFNEEPHHNITSSHLHNSTMNSTDCEAKAFTMNSQTAYTIPILAFAFVCHPEVLPIYTELRDATKSRMQKVANISILAMFVMYLLTALFGYLTFYSKSPVTHLRASGPLDVLILCVRLAVLIAVILTVPVVLFPIRRAVLQILFYDKPFHWARHIGIAFVPGATSAPSLIFILPAIFYIRIVPEEQEPLKSRPKIQAACFALLGFIFMVMSLTFIIADWVMGEPIKGGH
ncbi:Sodium-coupled neutral amino acid transporter 3 [Oryzias melastigma]|uniref:Sodium-coupled neutral amino acid transporter 3 n=1 Tax=Oryzias melastigma TaxID=30732 RepID=A0A834C1U3_ORYME|nr:Sodium-coupled neutral amino acid transporter 3 [Oryzias melastigma]